MLFGVSMFPTDYSIPPDRLARLVEERGFESLWFPEHTHIPASRLTPPEEGGELPKEYFHTYDPFVALTAAASATSTLKLATGICLLVQRDPITTAKEVASLDRLSNGRFMFGIGGGWNVEEIENQGISFGMRWRVLRERVLAMKEIWTKDQAEYHGDFVNFDKIWSYPKPVQKPHPPIIMGGDGLTTFNRVIEYCDGWVPILRTPERIDSLRDKISKLHQLAEDVGRDPATISISIFGVNHEGAVVERLLREKVDRLVFRLPSEQEDVVVPLLDNLTKLVKGLT